MARQRAELYTPDGRYLVIRGRLWRTTNPNLPDETRADLVNDLMDARRAVAAAKRADDRKGEITARARVDLAKRALGERGPVWWTDGTPDYNRHLLRTTPYASWYAALAGGAEDAATNREAANGSTQRTANNGG
jgi:hypothetical protein